jgi:hypothetical protein
MLQLYPLKIDGANWSAKERLPFFRKPGGVISPSYSCNLDHIDDGAATPKGQHCIKKSKM